MMRETVVPLVVIALVACAGWYYREPLKDQFDKSRSSLGAASSMGSQSPAPVPTQRAPESAPHKDTIYRRVDENGVTHFDQQASAGSQAVEVDQSKIQSLGSYYNKSGQPAAKASTSTTNPTAREQSEAKRRGMSPIESVPQAQSGHL